MKRFKASVIGGSGYGGAELIRRLLIHPEVELVRVASVDYVGQPLGAAHPPLTGRTRFEFENLSPQDAAAGCDVVLLGLPHKVSAEVGASAAGHRRQDRRHVGRLSAARRRRLTSATTAPSTPTPSCWARFVYGLPELNRERHPAARRRSPRPGCFATTIELALLPLARAGLLRRRGARGGHHRLVGQRRGAQRRHPPPGARGEPQELQAARAPAHARRSSRRWPTPAADAGAGSSCASCRCRRRCRAASSPPASSSCPPARPATSIAGLYQRRLRGRAVRALPRATARPRWRRCRARTTPRSASPSASRTADDAHAGGAGRHRQPDQGRRRQAIQNMNLMLGLPETLSLEDPGPLAVADRGARPWRRCVVKLGGDVLEDPARGAGGGGAGAGRAARWRGARLVVVHGGGAQVTALPDALGLETRHGGRPAHHRRRHAGRAEDGGGRAAERRAVRGPAAARACAAVGLHAGSGVIRARRRPPRVVSGGGPDPIDFGLVGDVTGFDRALLDALWARRLPAGAVLPGPGRRRARC